MESETRQGSEPQTEVRAEAELVVGVSALTTNDGMTEVLKMFMEEERRSWLMKDDAWKIDDRRKNVEGKKNKDGEIVRWKENANAGTSCGKQREREGI